jgi:hypothetical protein
MHNLATMRNNMEAAEAGKSVIVINQAQPQMYPYPMYPMQYVPNQVQYNQIPSDKKIEIKEKDPILESLESIKELRNANILTEEEYTNKRKEIIQNAYK